MRRPFALKATLSFVVLAWCASAFALNPDLDISQYAHTAWRVRDGFAKGAILSIAQTPDGYLWLGTEFGLLRFDGVRAVPWHPPGGEQLPSNYISALLVAHDGTLWIGTLSGLASWRNSTFTRYPEVAQGYILSLLEDRQQTIWIGATEAFKKGRLCALRGGKIDCYGDGAFGDSVAAAYQDREDNLWVSSQNELWRWAPAPPTRYAFPRGEIEVDSLIEDDEGKLLLAANDGLKQLVSGKIENYSLPGITGQIRPGNFLRSSDGSLWIGTSQGLMRLHKERVDRFSAVDGLSGDRISRLFEDREGSVWVVTSDGLDRFREYAIPTIARSQGLSSKNIYAVQASPDGSIWIATTDGLNRWANGRVTVYRDRSAFGQSRRVEGTELRISGVATEIANSGLAGTPNSLGMDDAGRLWVATDDSVFYFDRGRFFRVPGLPGRNTFSFSGDGYGNVWILQREHLFYWSPNTSVQEIPLSQFSQETIRTMLPDRDPGGLWLGFYQGGVVYLKDGKVVRPYGSADGLGGGRVNSLRFGSGEKVLAATEGGLSRIDDSHIHTLTSRNGLPCDEVNWSMEDDDHNVWLNMPCGLVRIERAEWYAWVDDPGHLVKTTIFDSSDGVRSVGLYAHHASRVTKSPDGKLWFSPFDGVSVIDPQHLPFNAVPPPVHVEQLMADQKAYDLASEPNGHLRLPPLVRGLEIDYTALSFVAPEKVLFRYKLEGLDRDWHDAGNRRQAFYTNLPPRHYRFRVAACNNSGVWNEAGAFLDFSIAPAYYQMTWFRALWAAAFLALLWAVYQVRVRQLRSEEQKFREAVETMPALAFIARSDGQRTFVNSRWVEYTGLTEKQALGWGWQVAVHPNDLSRALTTWQEAQTSGNALEYEARILRSADGDYRWFQTRAVPVRDKRGKIVKWYGVINDIEDRKRAEELQAELAHITRVNTMVELTASLAHDIKQPIGAAVTNAEACARLLDRDQPDVLEAREAALEMARDAKHAAQIIDRVRSLYRKDSSHWEMVDVNEIIDEMVMLLRGESHRYAISLRTDLAELPQIKADRVQLQQVFMNLILNAIEAMKDTGGDLSIRSQRNEDDELLVSVTDNGVGLPAGRADEIFKAFFTTKSQGTGMGLAITRSIVESHGGRIWATANSERGTTFYFTLSTTVA